MTKKLFVALSLALLAAVAWALPTVDQVQTEVQRGNYAQAETMMREVVEAKPGSAKAHYLYAEILAHNGSFAKASDEAKRAQQIDPDTKFTQPEKFRAFQQLLERELTPAPRAQSSATRMSPVTPAESPIMPRAPAIPSWVWVAGLGVVGFLLWRGFARSRGVNGPAMNNAPAAVGPAAYATNSYGNGYGAPPAPMPYGAGMPPQAPSASRGLLGTGLAVAGGVAAGMLVDEMLHRRQEPGVDRLGGLGPNSFDAPFQDDSARELENRPIDFGNGGGWDNGGDAGAGSSDNASSDNSDDGGWS